MTIFTKQEQRFLLFLMVTFAVGLAVKFVRKNIKDQPDEKWLAQRQQILAEFEKKTIQISRQDSSDITTTQPKRIKKESLTKSININVASFEELQILPRIGPATAQKIIAFREQHGPFSTIEEIQHVKNIGPRTFENIKDYITVD